ncbi:hypothetical protein, partial [Nocardia cyriacigeorgica]|uniref:hypothetical protein n=1 Tax=Nocardia cyriacigeorgica TaxID=135487 RepID=UPI002457A174
GYFMPLRAGARLVVATPDGHRDPAYVAETIAAQQVTVTDFSLHDPGTLADLPVTIEWCNRHILLTYATQARKDKDMLQ